MKSKWPFIILAVYLVAGLALFDKCLDNPFIMDDENQITLNPFIQNLSLWPSYFTGSTMGFGGPKDLGGVYYKPLMTSYYALIWHFFGSDPLAYRWPLLIMHIFNAWMVALLLSSFTSIAFSAIAGMLFLIHPMNTEIVAYIANAQDSLYLFFGLISLLLLRPNSYPRARLMGVSLALVLSLLSKETGALFLILVPLYAYYFTPQLWRRILQSCLAILVVYSSVRLSIGLTSFRNPILKLHNASLVERWFTVPDLTWHYFYEYFWNLESALNRDYLVSSLEFTNFWGPLAALITIALIIIALLRTARSRNERSAIVFFGALLGLWFFLHSHILIPLDGTVSDRWFYLGQIGIVGTIGIGASRLSTRTKIIEYSFLVAGVLLTLLAAQRSWVRLDLWSTPLKLYQADFERFPDDAIMANNIGVELFRSGETKDARAYFEKAITLNSKWAVPVNNLGAIEENSGFNDRALDLYYKALLLDTYPLAFENYARLLCARPELESTCRAFLIEKALPLFPRNAKIVAIAKQMQIDIPK